MKDALNALLPIIVIALFLFTGGIAAAEDAPSQEVSELLQAACPGSTVAVYDQCGFTAAAVLLDQGTQVLCVAQETADGWKTVVCNATALRQDASVSSLLLDTDETLYWTYAFENGADTYHAVCTNGQWRVAGLKSTETHVNGNVTEYHLWYSEGRLHYSTCLCDAQDNILSTREYTPAPAQWLDSTLPLAVFDDTLFPKPDDYTHSWLSREATARAAAELFPADTFLDGCAEADHLAFFLQKSDGKRVIACCRFTQQDGWRITVSTPLPEGTSYGFENFTSSLVIGDLLVNVGPVDENDCGVTYIYNIAADARGELMFALGKNHIASEASTGYHNSFGDHPWDDITAIDWSTLPHSLQEALKTMDSSGWAVVNNPNPADRLHLRAKPERGATSLGKYYNGTPVRVLEKKSDWVRVDVFGTEGWMMAKYLVFGVGGRAVQAAFPAKAPVESKADHFVYAAPELGQPIANCSGVYHSLVVLAVVGDEWYHVWFPQEGATGYVLQSDWWDGNG